MNLYSRAKSISGEVPGCPLDLVLNKMQDAIIKIFQQCDWSFQRGIVYANWLVPGNVATSGTTTVTPYSNIVTMSPAASQAFNNYLSSPGAVLATQLQYRDPQYSIYNIVGLAGDGTTSYVTVYTPGSAQVPGTYMVPVVDNGGSGSGGLVAIIVNADGTCTLQPTVVTSGTGYTNPSVTLAAGGVPATFQVFENIVLTLDRPWMEPTNGPGQSYMIYQCYLVAPCQFFNKFIEMRDTTDGAPIDFWSMTQAELAGRDPQRLRFSDPAFCVAAGVDNRPGTSTPGWNMYELWPQQLSYEPYSFSYRSLGPVPQTQLDFMSYTPPYPVSYELIEWRTREILYQWKEAQKDKTEARGAGSNWMLLTQWAEKEYAKCLDPIIAIDLNLNNEAISRTAAPLGGVSDRPFANRLGMLNVGGYPDNRDY